MKKHLSLILALILALLITPAVSAAAITAETEGNNSSAVADVISNGQIRGSMASGDDVDWYKFTANKDYFELTFELADKHLFESVGDGWAVTIYNQDMDELLFYRTTDAFSTPRMPISGTIYIKVATGVQYSWETHPVAVPYQISFTNTADNSWENEYNDSSKTANVISANKVYHGSLQHDSDVDWFKSTSADYFNVTFNANNKIDTSYEVNDGWTVSLYDSALNCLASFKVTTTDTSINFPVTGVVYVKVETAAEYSWQVSPNHFYYDLQVNSVVDGTWENEYNDSVTTATAIAQGKTYTGNLMSDDDVDYYKVKTTSKAFSIVFDVRSDEVDVDCVHDGWNISVYPKDSNTPIDNFVVKSLGTTQSITLPYAQGKEYYIAVKSAVQYSWEKAPAGETYHLSVIDTSEGNNWEVETRTTGVKSAATLKEAAKIYGNLYAKGDDDYYKCNIISGGTINVTFNREASDNDGDGYLIKVIDAAGTVVDSVEVDNDTSATLSKVKVSKGTYYIIVTNADRTAPGAEINYNVSFKLTLAKHSIKKITTTKNTLKVSWAKKSDVNGYQIQYATNKNFKNAKTVTINKNSTTSTTIKNTSASKVYYVRIRTIVKDGSNTRYSAWSSATLTANTPTVKTVKLSGKNLKITWNKNSSASGYQIQYATNKNFKDAKTVKINNKNTASYTIKKLSDNKVYYVRVRTVVKGSTTYYSSWTSASVVVTGSTMKKVTPGSSTLKLTWSKNSGASGYQIQYATNKNFKNAKTVKINKNSTTSYTIKKISNDKTYYIRIRAFVKSGSTTKYAAWSDASVAVTAPTVKKVTPSKGTLKVSWSKTSGATSYQIQYATNKNFKNAKTVTAKSTATSTTIKNTSAKQTYYIRIRAVAKSTTTYYSLWSSASSIKAK